MSVLESGLVNESRTDLWLQILVGFHKNETRGRSRFVNRNFFFKINKSFSEGSSAFTFQEEGDCSKKKGVDLRDLLGESDGRTHRQPRDSVSFQPARTRCWAFARTRWTSAGTVAGLCDRGPIYMQSYSDHRRCKKTYKKDKRIVWKGEKQKKNREERGSLLVTVICMKHIVAVPSFLGCVLFPNAHDFWEFFLSCCQKKI
jgi:hypothetical protein